jgi:hypothetical protein
MLIPTKHDHPDLTVLAISAVVLRIVKRVKTERYEILRAKVTESNPYADPLFMPALLTLRALGLVEYHPKTDSLAYVGK